MLLPHYDRIAMEHCEMVISTMREMASYYFQELCFGDRTQAKLAKFDQQIGLFLIGGEPWLPPIKSDESTQAYYWSRQVVRAPELSTVALFICAIHPTEACVERSFSHQDLINSDLRNLLSEISVQALIRLRFNFDSLFQSRKIMIDADGEFSE